MDARTLERIVVPLVRVPWHGTHSGYDRIIDGLPVHRATPRARAASRLAGALARRAFRSELSFHPSEMIAAELEAVVRLRLGVASVLHYLYAEEHAWYGPALVRRGDRPFIASYHQPPAYLERLLPARAWARLLDPVEVVTVVSRSQEDFFSQYVGPERIRLVAHGVDTGFFSPEPARDRRGPARTCLTVGWWLRDFDLLRSVQEALRRRFGSRLRFEVITSRREATRGWPEGVTTYWGLSDDAILRHYRAADVLALPLADGTANNVLLEAMACGLPVVVTATEGVRDYVDPSCARLVPVGDGDAMADAIAAILDGDAAELGRAARLRALAFDWAAVRSQLLAVYRHALDAGA